MFLKCVFLTVLAAAVALRGWCALRVHSLFSMDYILTFEFRHMLCSLPTMKQVLDDQALFADGGVVVFTDPNADIFAPVCCFVCGSGCCARCIAISIVMAIAVAIC